jgi:hypothetical protein
MARVLCWTEMQFLLFSSFQFHASSPRPHFLDLFRVFLKLVSQFPFLSLGFFPTLKPVKCVSNLFLFGSVFKSLGRGLRCFQFGWVVSTAACHGNEAVFVWFISELFECNVPGLLNGGVMCEICIHRLLKDGFWGVGQSVVINISYNESDAASVIL